MAKKARKHSPRKSPQNPASGKPASGKPESFDMAYYLVCYPPPHSQAAPHRSKPHSTAGDKQAASTKTSSGLQDFDMNAALNLYPPNSKPQPQRKNRQIQGQQTKASPSSAAAEAELQGVSNWQTLLANYSPREEDLTSKIAAEEHEEIRHKGRQRQYQRREFKQRNIIYNDEIDLHGMLQEEAQEQLQEFFRQAIQHGKRKILIIHGKGHHSHQGQGVLQKLVTEFLLKAKATGEIQEFCHPPERNGGKGATVALLRCRSKFKT